MNDREGGRLLEQTVCTRCGCLCDDVGVTVEGSAIVEARHGCDVGKQWLTSRGEVGLRAIVDGRAVDVNQALTQAAKLVADSAAPAMIGLGALSIESAREALELAEACQMAVVPLPERSAALQRAGMDAPEFTASLGAVRATADLVIFWRADPLVTHPRHLERYSWAAPLILGKSRWLVIVGDADQLRASETAKLAARTINLAADSHGHRADLEYALELRMMLEHDDAGPAADESGPGAQLAALIREAEHTHLFMGVEAGDDPALRDALHELAASVRASLHVTVSTLPRPGNEIGVLELLTWRSGTPGPLAPIGAADRSHWLPGIADSPMLWNRNLFDLLVVVGATLPGEESSSRWADCETPRIVIDTCDDPKAAVSIVIPGLDPRLRGTVVRSDGIALSLCGDPSQGVEDPAVALLRDLRGRLRSAEAAR